MNADNARPIFAALFLFLLVAISVGTNYLHKRQKAKHHEEQKQRIQEGMAKGECNEFGEPLCVICGAVALHTMPTTGKMWFDKIPVFSLLNDLMAMPWRYVIEDDMHGAHKLCSRHRKAAERRLKEAHSQLRAEHAQFNARAQERLALLDQGGLEQLLLNDDKLIKQQLGYVKELPTALRNATSSSVDALYILPGRSSMHSETTE